MDRKRAFWIWKLLLTIASLIIAIWCKSNIDWKNISNNYVDIMRVKEIIYDICIGILSAMVLVWFIEEINDRIQEKKNREVEAQKIKCFDRLLQLYIERYKLFYYCIVTPSNQRDYENIVIPEEFTFKDMKDLYQSTLLMSEGLFDKAIEGFIKAEEDLKLEIEAMIRNVEFEFFPEIRECLEEFVEISIKYNQKNALLRTKNVRLGEKTMQDVVSEALEDYADIFYEKLKAGEVKQANLLHPYVALYEMLKGEYACIKTYENEICKLNQ